MEKILSSLNFYAKYLSEKVGSFKICFKIVAPLYARGNLRGNQPGAQELNAVGEATKVWAVKILAPFFYTNTTTISWQNHTDRFQRAFAGWLLTGLCPSAHANTSWTKISGFSSLRTPSSQAPPKIKPVNCNQNGTSISASSSCYYVSCKTFRQHSALFTKGSVVKVKEL